MNSWLLQKQAGSAESLQLVLKSQVFKQRGTTSGQPSTGLGGRVVIGVEVSVVEETGGEVMVDPPVVTGVDEAPDETGVEEPDEGVDEAPEETGVEEEPDEAGVPLGTVEEPGLMLEEVPDETGVEEDPEEAGVEDPEGTEEDPDEAEVEVTLDVAGVEEDPDEAGVDELPEEAGVDEPGLVLEGVPEEPGVEDPDEAGVDELPEEAGVEEEAGLEEEEAAEVEVAGLLVEEVCC